MSSQMRCQPAVLQYTEFAPALKREGTQTSLCIPIFVLAPIQASYTIVHIDDVDDREREPRLDDLETWRKVDSVIVGALTFPTTGNTDLLNTLAVIDRCVILYLYFFLLVIELHCGLSNIIFLKRINRVSGCLFVCFLPSSLDLYFSQL